VISDTANVSPPITFISIQG